MASNGIAPRVESVGFDDLTLLAHRLNSSSDDLNAALRRIEARLNALALGIETFVPIETTREYVNEDGPHQPEEYEEHQLGYGRLGDGWGLLTRTAHFTDGQDISADPDTYWDFGEQKSLLRASRDTRIHAVSAIPELLKQLKSEADKVLSVVEAAQRLADEGSSGPEVSATVPGDSRGRQVEFEFGETVAANQFWDRNPGFFPSFARLVNLTNKTFGREWRATNRMEDVGFNLGETCRQDFLEIAFLAVNGHGTAAQKLLRGFYERAVTLEYIRRNPDKAERFVRFGAIQEYKVFKTAIDLVGQEEVEKYTGSQLAEYEKLYAEVRPEFQVTDCKKCHTKRQAISWDVDFASMVRKLGQPYQSLYMASYALPNLLVHATATSAFSREPNYGTPEEKNIQAAEVSLIHATLILVLVLNSQSEIFSLGLDQETKACWDEVTTVWEGRPHGLNVRIAK